jgi:integrase
MQLNRSESSSKLAFHCVAENLWRRESSGVYYAFLKRGRKQFHRSLKTKDRELAKRRLSELRAEVGSLVTHDAAALNFDILADRWQDNIRHTVKESTAARRKSCLKALSPFFAGLALRNITPAHCEAWVTKRGYKIAPQTFAHELDTMNGVFDYAKEQGLILRNPAQSIKRKRILPAKVEIPTLEQFRRLVAAIRHSDGRPDSQAKAKDGADLVELLAYSGCRLNEACNLRWRDMHFDRSPPCFTVTGGERMTKNYETRTVPMTDALLGLLSRLHTERQPKPGDLIAKIASAKKCLGTACKRLGIPRFTHHDFRHFFATTCIESGVDIPTISKWLGHKDGGALAMKVYGHLRQEHSFAQVKRVQFGSEQSANDITLAESMR